MNALISSHLQEGASDGKTVAEFKQYGATMLTHDDVIESIAEIIHEIQIQTTLADERASDLPVMNMILMEALVKADLQVMESDAKKLQTENLLCLPI